MGIPRRRNPLDFLPHALAQRDRRRRRRVLRGTIRNICAVHHHLQQVLRPVGKPTELSHATQARGDGLAQQKGRSTRSCVVRHGLTPPAVTPEISRITIRRDDRDSGGLVSRASRILTSSQRKGFRLLRVGGYETPILAMRIEISYGSTGIPY